MGGTQERHPFFAYNANYLIDNKLGIIVDAGRTRANRSDEIAVTSTMIARVEKRFGLAPQRLAGDTAYSGESLSCWASQPNANFRHWDVSFKLLAAATARNRPSSVPTAAFPIDL